MKIYVVDFEMALKNFEPYHESLDKIQSEKQKFSDQIDLIKKEMEFIISSSRSLLLDEKTQNDNAVKFKDLQSKAIKLESEFRNDIVELQNSELEKNFRELSLLVNDWSSSLSLDLVLNKSQTLFTNEKYDATSVIIDIIKERGLYKEFVEEIEQ